MEAVVWHEYKIYNPKWTQIANKQIEMNQSQQNVNKESVTPSVALFHRNRYQSSSRWNLPKPDRMSDTQSESENRINCPKTSTSPNTTV